MKKILIHSIGAHTGGAVRHLVNLIKSIATLDHTNHYEIFIRNNLSINVPYKNFHITRIPEKKASNWLSRIYFDIFELPRIIRRDGYSCIISLMNFGPIWVSVPHIIFQCNSLYYSTTTIPEISAKEKFELTMRRSIAAASMKYADAVVTPSHSTKNEILALYPTLPKEKFYVIYHGLDPQQYADFFPQHPKIQLKKNEQYNFLYPAHLLTHKAHDILISIAHHLKSKIDFQLFLTIDKNENPEKYEVVQKRIKAYNLEANVICIGNIPQNQIGHLYKKCDLMIFSSLIESFGFPLLEAMTHGCPIVASDIEINREICGGAALYYAPFNPEDGAQKVLQSLDQITRYKLLEGGQQRLKERNWSWEFNARSLLSLIDQICSS